jgi:hypothetical protein
MWSPLYAGYFRPEAPALIAIQPWMAGEKEYTERVKYGRENMISFSKQAAVWGCLAVLAAAGTLRAEQTNGPAAGDGTNEVAKLMRVAGGLAEAGEPVKAARLYELIATRHPDVRLSVAGRICRLYAEGGVTNKALSWASEVQRVHPDPQVFLSGIQAELKNYAAAAGILEGQIAVAPSAQRRISLLWQLGALREKQGEFAKARQAFEQAVNAATSEAERDAARRRLEKFSEVQKAAAKTAAARKTVAAATNAPALPAGGPVKARTP